MYLHLPAPVALSGVSRRPRRPAGKAARARCHDAPKNLAHALNFCPRGCSRAQLSRLDLRRVPARLCASSGPGCHPRPAGGAGDDVIASPRWICAPLRLPCRIFLKLLECARLQPDKVGPPALQSSASAGGRRWKQIPLGEVFTLNCFGTSSTFSSAHEGLGAREITGIRSHFYCIYLFMLCSGVRWE